MGEESTGLASFRMAKSHLQVLASLTSWRPPSSAEKRGKATLLLALMYRLSAKKTRGTSPLQRKSDGAILAVRRKTMSGPSICLKTKNGSLVNYSIEGLRKMTPEQRASLRDSLADPPKLPNNSNSKLKK